MMTTEPGSTAGSASAAPSGVSVWAKASDCFERWQRGEDRALDDLVRTLSPVLWHVVRAYGLDQARAEDVVQTTWLSLVRRHDSITEPRAIGSWLTTTARREAWRVSRSESRATPTADDVLERRVPDERSAESEAVQSDEQQRLWACVRELSERCQRLLRIVAFDDRPDYAGISRDLGIPVGSIGPTRGRCLAKLRDALSKHDHEETPHD